MSVDRSGIDLNCSSNSSRSRVLVVAHDAALYGAQHSLLDILKQVDREKFDPLVVIPTRGAFTDILHEINVPYIPWIVQRWVSYPKHIKLLKLVKGPWRSVTHPYFLTMISLVSLPVRVMLLAAIVHIRKIDLIYTNTATVLDGAITAKLCRIPHVWHLREAIAGNPDIVTVLPLDWVPAFVSRNSAVVITNSKSLARKLFGDEPPPNLEIIHNGIDIELYRAATPTKTLPDLPMNVRLVAICGAIHARKDILTFIRAAARLKAAHPLLHYLIVGHGQSDYCMSVEKEIAQNGLDRHVHLLGHRSDIPALLACVDILVNASTQEPFGRTIIEAMAAGKPVVATRSGGPEEIIEDEISGYLVEVGDDQAMAERIAYLLNYSKRMQAMSDAARLRVEAYFELSSVVKRIEEVFEAAVLHRIDRLNS